jgi:hypothetical protein
MIKDNNIKNITAALQENLVNACRIDRDFVRADHLDFKSFDLQSIYNSGSFAPHQVAAIRLFQEFLARYTEGSSKANDDRCWEKFKDSQVRCAEQNQMIALHTISKSSWNRVLFDILDNAAGIISEACDRVDSQSGLGTDPEAKYPLIFMDADLSFDVQNPFVKEQRFAISGFDTGPGTTWETTADIIGKFPKKGQFVITDHLLCSGVNRYYENVANYLLKSHNAFKALKMSLYKTSAVKASFVPKKDDISRDIVPQLNGDLLFQFPICKYLLFVLQELGIDLPTQEIKQQARARKGSLYGSVCMTYPIGRHRAPIWCTMDLTTASHLVGWNLCDKLFPQWLYDQMVMTRCENVVNKHYHGTTDIVTLQAMATMGNAYCFPMQTLVFLTIGQACLRALSLPEDWISVYGDDIIIDHEAYDLLVRVLESLYMVPNKKKSFSRGHFRESCGGDFYQGVNIRPVSPRSLTNLSDAYSLINQLNDWFDEHRILMSDQLCAELAKMVIAFHSDFSVQRNKKLKKVQKNNKPFFLVPMFSNLSEGFKMSRKGMLSVWEDCRTIVYDNLFSHREGAALSRFVVSKIYSNFKAHSHEFDETSMYSDEPELPGSWYDTLYQSEVVSYSVLSTEAYGRPVNVEEVAVLHTLRCSGVYRAQSDGSKKFFIAGKSDGRLVQRNKTSPLTQWDTLPEGGVFLVSNFRLANERKLLAAMCVKLAYKTAGQL